MLAGQRGLQRLERGHPVVPPRRRGRQLRRGTRSCWAAAAAIPAASRANVPLSALIAMSTCSREIARAEAANAARARSGRSRDGPGLRLRRRRGPRRPHAAARRGPHARSPRRRGSAPTRRCRRRTARSRSRCVCSTARTRRRGRGRGCAAAGEAPPARPGGASVQPVSPRSVTAPPAGRELTAGRTRPSRHVTTRKPSSVHRCPSLRIVTSNVAPWCASLSLRKVPSSKYERDAGMSTFARATQVRG